jgi:WD40-like Beta Propeller Repeat
MKTVFSIRKLRLPPSIGSWLSSFCSGLLLVQLLALGAGCTFNAERPGDGGTTTPPPGTTPIAGLTAMRVAPDQAMVVLDLTKAPPTQKFEAYGTINGHEQKITDRVSWSTDRAIVAHIDNNGMATVGTSGGIATLTARNGNLAAAGKLTVQLTGVFLADGAGANPALPANPGSKFTGTDTPARAPQLVYPNNNVLFPPNVFGIEVHFRKGDAANTLFELHFKSAIGDFTVYTRCVTLADGCVYAPSRQVWSYIAETNRGAGQMQLTVRGTDDSGTAVGKSAMFTIQFSKDDIRGGLYYWTTSGDTGIMRWNFGDTTATVAERFIGTQFTGGTCVGCHALSRDGKKIVASAGGQNSGKVLLFDVAHAKPLATYPLAQLSQFESWDPTGTRYVGVYTDDKKTGPSDLIMFDGTSGAVTGKIALGGRRADHPDWSPDGKRIVFTNVDTAGNYTDQRPGKSGISYADDDGTGTWTAQDLLPAVAGKNRYYPGISPDTSYPLMVFDESTCPAGTSYGTPCNADSDPSAKMWTTPLPPAAAKLVELAAANAPGVADQGVTDLTNSFPKWAPFTFQLDEQHKLLWLTVSSIRQYGLRKPPAGAGSESASSTLIWMVGFDPTAVAQGQDPSFAAFCLPFQDITTSNHIAQWTQEVVGIIP